MDPGSHERRERWLRTHASTAHFVRAPTLVRSAGTALALPVYAPRWSGLRNATLLALAAGLVLLVWGGPIAEFARSRPALFAAVIGPYLFLCAYMLWWSLFLDRTKGAVEFDSSAQRLRIYASRDQGRVDFEIPRSHLRGWEMGSIFIGDDPPLEVPQLYLRLSDDRRVALARSIGVALTPPRGSADLDELRAACAEFFGEANPSPQPARRLALT